MKVNGQLEVAQLENLSADPALLPRARMWFDKVLGKVRVFDGSTTKSLAFDSTTSTAPYDAGLASISKTITWSNGNIQRVRITTGCVFSFVGGVDGTEYTLIIDSNTSTPAPYVLNMGPQESGNRPIIPPCMNYGETRIHKFLYRDTFPTAVVTTTQASDVSPYTYSNGVATGTCLDIFAPGGIFGEQPFISVGTTGATNQWNLYPFRKFYGKMEWAYSGALTATGASHVSQKFSPSGSYFAVVTGSSPYLNITRTAVTTYSTTYPTAFSNPATLPTGAGTAASWHPTERAIAISHTTSPYVSVYPWSAAGFGTKFSNPGTLPTGNGLCVAFNPVGDYIAVTHTTTPFISVYPIDLIIGFGGKVADPSPLPATQTVGSPRSVAWSPAGDWIVMGTGTTPYVWSCPFNRSTGTFGTPQTAPVSNIPAGEVRSVAFSKDGAYIFIGATGSAAIFPFDSTNGINWTSPLTTSFAALTYIDAVWSNHTPTLFTVVTATVGAPIAHTAGYYQKNWVRILDSVQ